MSITGASLKEIIHQVVTEIGPRPAGHPAEARARAVIENLLREAGIRQIESLPFLTLDTWGYGTVIPAAMGLLGGLLPVHPLIRAALVLFATYQMWLMMRGQLNAQILWSLYPKHPSATLLARIPPQETIIKRIVLVGHVDSNRHRMTFSPIMKHWIIPATSLLLSSMLVCVLAILFNWAGLYLVTMSLMAVGFISFLLDETGGYVDGANDNGSAVACVLGVGRQAQKTPLRNTEVWLAFTGEEEVTHQGLNTLLDRYGDQLHNAQFIDFEMVGSGNIHFALRQSGLVFGTAYSPDPASVALAQQTASAHPELNVTGREVLILDEVATLRRRGFNAICLVGLAPDGFPANWHQKSDTLENIDPVPLENAARFAWAMAQILDQATVS
jgi:hypothetical protein